MRDQAQRCSRVLLDIEAGAPVLLIPESSRSNNLIVANLGKLKVKNKFLFAGFPGTFTLQDKVSSQHIAFSVYLALEYQSKNSDATIRLFLYFCSIRGLKNLFF